MLGQAVQVRVSYQALLKHTMVAQDAWRLREKIVGLHDPVQERRIESERLSLTHPPKAVRCNEGQALHEI
jgi:hypothetical protein